MRPLSLARACSYLFARFLAAQSFALADIQNANEHHRYHILECRSTITRFKRVAEMLTPELNMLVAQKSLKSLGVGEDETK